MTTRNVVVRTFPSEPSSPRRRAPLAGVPGGAQAAMVRTGSNTPSTFSVDRMPEIITELRKHAAEIGCDGLVINGPNNSVIGDRYGTSTLHGYNGTCIAYTDAPLPHARK